MTPNISGESISISGESIRSGNFRIYGVKQIELGNNRMKQIKRSDQRNGTLEFSSLLGAGAKTIFYGSCYKDSI